MKKYDFEYWENEIKNKFPHKTKLKENNYFVISYIMAPPPCNCLVHEIINFSDFNKMVSFIQHLIVRRAIGDTLDLDFDEAMSGSFDELIADFCKDNELSNNQKKAIDMYYELDHLIYAPAEISKEWLRDFRNRFEKLFKRCANCVFGMEIVFPEESLVDFWVKFFDLDCEDEYDAEEIDAVKKALETGNGRWLESLLVNHC